MADQTQNAPRRPGLLTRVAGAVAYTITGIDPYTWMSPLQPLHPMAEQSKGRAWDYPVAFNLNYIPRADEPLSFWKLKTLAEYGIVRTVIQTRIDQMTSMEWIIRPKELERGKRPAGSKYAGKTKEITEFLLYPDRRLDWQQWLTMWLEQHFVYDAVAVLKRRTYGKKPYAFQIVDGSTISVKIDADGRPHPPPPSPAYQQVLKGMPASNYTATTDDGPTFTTGDMLYYAKNTRVDRAYGFPPVAQIINYVEMTLARAREQLAEYTSGNTPVGILEGPNTLNPDQIQAMQDRWDSLFAGNIEQRRRQWWVPNGTVYHEFKRELLFDAFDEWLARVVCYAFSTSPTPFIKQMNRATANNSQEVAVEEGLQPTMKSTARVMNRLIQSEFDAPDLEFAWIEDDEFDPSKKAVIDNLKVRAGIVSIDEVRESDGREPMGGVFSMPMYATPNGYVPVDPVEAQELLAPPAPEPGSPGGGNAQPGGKAGAGAKPSGSPGKGSGKGSKQPSPKKNEEGEQNAQANKSLLIVRKLLNAHEVDAWAKSQGFTDVLPLHEMKLVVASTREAIGWGAVPPSSSSVIMADEGGRSIGLHTETPLDTPVPVLFFDSPDVSARTAELMMHGLEVTTPRLYFTHSMKMDGFVVEKSADGKEDITRPQTITDARAFEGDLLFGEEEWYVIEDPYQQLLEKASKEEVDEAASLTDPSPTQGQIVAGNYRKGHVTIQGLDISIENEAGSRRSGVGPDGTAWSVVMPTHYGYIKRTEGADGDHVDVYIGPSPDSASVWVIDQVDADSGEFDEHKVMLGYDRWADAQRDYLAAFSDGKGHHRLGGVSTFDMPDFKAWLDNGDTREPLTIKSVDISTGLVAHDQGVGGRGRSAGGDYSTSASVGNYDDRQNVNEGPPYAQRAAKGVAKSGKRPFVGGRTTKYSDEQPRDDHGRWTSGGGGEGTGQSASDLLAAHSDPNMTVEKFYSSLTPETRAAIDDARARLAQSVPTDAPVSEGGFKNPDGSYTAEREALHDQILNSIFTDEAVDRATPKEGEKPTYTMLGGRGGSGKSNLTQNGGPVDTQHAILLDNDGIKAMLPGYQGWNAALYHEEASHIFARADAAAREAGLNVVHDATMKTMATAERYMGAYEAAGYDVKGYYMFAPPQVAAQRAMDRFMNPKAWNASTGSTGRFVPPEYVLSSTTNERSFDSVKGRMSDWAIYSSVAGKGGSFGIKLVSRK